jgi:AraC family L-rhamnose operon regulatory protein RhaS
MAFAQLPSSVSLLRERPVEVVMPAHGVFLLESHHAATFRMEASSHEFLELFYVMDGTGSFLIDGQAHPCRAGDVMSVPVGRVHQIADEPARPLSLYGICVAPQVWEHEPTLAALLPAGRLNVDGQLVGEIRSSLRRMLFEQTLGRPLGRTAILGMTLQLLTTLARSHASEAKRRERGLGHDPGAGAEDHRAMVRRYVDDLRREFFEPGDLDQAAARLGISRRRFTQLFRELTATSWSDHITTLRIDHACRLLAETGRSVPAIAFECGYEDLSSFYRAFKRRTNVPPSEWRSRQSREDSPQRHRGS